MNSNSEKTNFNGYLLRTVRLKNGMKQVQFAKTLGITKNYLYMLESGKRNPGEDLLKRISLYTDISIETLTAQHSNPPDILDDPNRAECLVELTNRLDRERYERKIADARVGELEKLTEHLMALNALLSWAGCVYRQQTSTPEMAKKHAAIAREAAKGGALCFGEIQGVFGIEADVLTRWLKSAKMAYTCRLFKENTADAFTPGEAGVKLGCFDCDAREKGTCNGFGDAILSDNIFGIISMLEANGIMNRNEQAEIVSRYAGREISGHQISDILSKKKHGLPVSEDLIYLTRERLK
jgi:transcriptional regulator with XRE-family HTH domain